MSLGSNKQLVNLPLLDTWLHPSLSGSVKQKRQVFMSPTPNSLGEAGIDCKVWSKRRAQPPCYWRPCYPAPQKKTKTTSLSFWQDWNVFDLGILTRFGTWPLCRILKGISPIATSFARGVWRSRCEHFPHPPPPPPPPPHHHHHHHHHTCYTFINHALPHAPIFRIMESWHVRPIPIVQGGGPGTHQACHRGRSSDHSSRYHTESWQSKSKFTYAQYQC